MRTEVVMLKRFFLFLILCLALTMYQSSFAQDEDYDDEGVDEEEEYYEEEAPQRLFVNGFMTAGYAKSDTKIMYNPQARAASNDNNGMFNNSGNENTLSKYGLQFSFTINESTQLYAQLLARGFETEQYEPQTDWAFIQTQLSENFQVRVGRVRVPFGLFAETQEVNFTYHWTTLPDEIYSIKIVNSVNGSDLRYHTDFGDDSSLTIDFWSGNSQLRRRTNTNFDYEINLTNVRGTTIGLNISNLKFQLNYLDGLVDQQRVAEGSTDAQAQAANLSDEYLVFTEDKLSGYQYGVYYEDDFIFAAEANSINIKGQEGLDYTNSGYYVSLGYFLNENLIPHITVAETEETYDRNAIDIKTNDPKTGSAILLRNNDVVRWSTIKQRTVTVGMKYIWNTNSAIKFDYSRVHVPFINKEDLAQYDVFDSTGTVDTTQNAEFAISSQTGGNTGYFAQRPNRDINVYKVSYDVVF